MTKVLNKNLVTIEPEAEEFIEERGLADAIEWMKIEIPKRLEGDGLDILLQGDVEDEGFGDSLTFVVYNSDMDHGEFMDRVCELRAALRARFENLYSLSGIIRRRSRG
ncbi:MAG: hypothetical protein NUW37_17315 [Planctomycetes bacterium]|nr:hypothetical protein [Planctomycetota bacterium]